VTKNNFDVIVVGAGPAGIFACYELIQKNKNLKIALVDKGNRIENRKPNEIMFGFGGAGAYSDGKLHFTPNFLMKEPLILLILRTMPKFLTKSTKFYGFGVDAPEFPSNKEEVS
jgi:uncharacterized FAD-dependent dehydrogenase